MTRSRVITDKGLLIAGFLPRGRPSRGTARERADLVCAIKSAYLRVVRATARTRTQARIPGFLLVPRRLLDAAGCCAPGETPERPVTTGWGSVGFDLVAHWSPLMVV